MKSVYVGNFLDFLEFSLFAALLPIISLSLFENYDPNTRVLVGYALLFVGFTGRPIGAYFLGKIGDKFSRKGLLILSVSGISISTLMLCLVPSTEYAWVFIASCRFLQGIFTGAELAAAMVYVVEKKVDQRPLKEMAYLISSGIFGASFALLIGFFVSCLDQNQYYWRLCFFAVSLMSLFVAFQRLRYIPNDNAKINVALKRDESTKNYIPQFLVAVVFGGLMNGMFYTITTFVNTFKMILDGNIAVGNLLVSFISTTVFAGALIFFSRSNIILKNKPEKVMMYAIFGMAVFTFPMFYFSMGNSNLFLAAVSQIALIFCCQAFSLCALSYLPFLFPESIRVQGCGGALGLGNSLLGGGTPFISAYLVQLSGSQYSPIMYLMFLIVMVFFGISFITNKKYVLQEQ